MTDLPHVSAVIVNYNTHEDTAQSVRTLLATTDARVQTIVVDNGSADGSVAILREQFPDTLVIDAGSNLGFAAGVNLGAQHADSPWVLLLNPDVVVLPGAVDALLEFAQQNPEYGVYGGRTLRPDGTTDPSSCWGAMSLWSLICFATGLSTLLRRSALFDPESLGRWERDTVREVPIVTGCLLLAARSTWDLLGGMDERYFLYGEDADFSARARATGLRPVIVPDAAIVHAVGGSTASSGRKMSMVMAGKATVLRTLWHPVAARIGITLLQTGAALRALPDLARRRESTWRTVWRSRRAWRTGYPAARTALFGPSAPSTPRDDRQPAQGAHR